MLGINSDGKADEVRAMLLENQITWRQAIDGGTDGPLATRWNVNGWPTIYVLDGKGVIRYRDLRDQALEDAVMKLLLEAQGDSEG